MRYNKTQRHQRFVAQLNDMVGFLECHVGEFPTFSEVKNFCWNAYKKNQISYEQCEYYQKVALDYLDSIFESIQDGTDPVYGFKVS